MSFESNLKAALNGKKLADLQDVEKSVSSPNMIIPTPAMIMQVVDALRQGKKFRAIQLSIKDNKRILTVGQIKEINRARHSKIAELQAVDKVESEEPVELVKE